MTGLQFIRVDKNEKPKPGRWTEYVRANERIHGWACEYPPCQPADRNDADRQIANEDAP